MKYGNCRNCGKELNRKPRHQLDDERKFCGKRCFWKYLDQIMFMQVTHSGKCKVERF